jgi:hypothetical protein
MISEVPVVVGVGGMGRQLLGGRRHRRSLGNRALGVPIKRQTEVTPAHLHARRVTGDA